MSRIFALSHAKISHAFGLRGALRSHARRSYAAGTSGGGAGISPRAMRLGALGAAAAAGMAYSSSSSSASFAEGTPTGQDKFATTKLFPPIEPYDRSTLKVSDIHTIAYTEYGNPKGKPVLFVHGGPGGGTDPAMARFFDPKVYRIILVDQRGCGDSTPFADLRDNTTYDSVKDFEKLRTKLGK